MYIMADAKSTIRATLKALFAFRPEKVPTRAYHRHVLELIDNAKTLRTVGRMKNN